MGDKLKEMIFNRFFKEKAREVEELREEVVILKNAGVKKDDKLREEETQRIEYENEILYLEDVEKNYNSNKELIIEGGMTLYESINPMDQERIIEELINVVGDYKDSELFYIEAIQSVTKTSYGDLCNSLLADEQDYSQGSKDALYEMSSERVIKNYRESFPLYEKHKEEIDKIFFGNMMFEEGKSVKDICDNVINSSKEIVTGNEINQLENSFVQDKVPGDMESIFELATMGSTPFTSEIENKFDFKNTQVNNFSVESIFGKNKISDLELE